MQEIWHIPRALSVLLGPSVLQGSDRLTWVEFLGIGLIYTGVVFRDEPNKKGPHILSKENSRPLSVIIVAHLAFIAIFFLLVETTIGDGSSFPTWIATTKQRDEAAVLGLFVVAELFSFIERKWLYRGILMDDENAQSALVQDDKS